GKNPFFEHAEAQYFLAVRDGRPVGRIAAIKNDAHTREHGDRVGFYGFFESVNEQAVANALFEAAAGWLSGKDFRVMRGPMNPSVNDDCGLLVAGFDTPPTIMMPHNPSRSEEHTSELQSRFDLVCRLLLEKKKITLTAYSWTSKL